jgi:Zn-dependent oligopeptidase
MEEIRAANEPFAPLKGARPPSSFAHLASYDMGYYGYLWSASVARDLVLKLRKDGRWDRDALAAFRDGLRGRTGGEAEQTPWAALLGRPANSDALVAWLSETP